MSCLSVLVGHGVDQRHDLLLPHHPSRLVMAQRAVTVQHQYTYDSRSVVVTQTDWICIACHCRRGHQTSTQSKRMD